MLLLFDMKIILLKDVPKLGRKGDVKNVADGYGRNMLIRNALAELATSEALKKAEEESKSASKQKEKAHSAFHALRAALMERGVVIRKKTNETTQKGAGQEVSLYAGVSPKEILEALRALKFPVPDDLDESMIEMEKHIKTTGTHEVKIKMPASPSQGGGGEEITVKIEVREIK